MPLTPRDPDFERRVRASFEQQAFMATLGARLSRVQPGEVHIELDFDPRLTQQDGFLHAGVGASLMDSAAGYAAFTLMEPDARVLSVEFKVNLLAPAKGQRFEACATVRKAGRTLSVVEGAFRAWDGGVAREVSTFVGTMMALVPR